MCYQTLIICPCTVCANKLAEASSGEPDPRTATESWWFCKRLTPEQLSKARRSSDVVGVLNGHPYQTRKYVGTLLGKDHNDENVVADECPGSGAWFTSDPKGKKEEK